MIPVLSRRALGRATLARHLLLERAPLDPETTVHDLLGLQAQVPAVPYTALWTRLADPDPTAASAALSARRLVRAATLRTTVHTLTAADALLLRPLVQPVMERTFAGTAWGRALRGHDITPVLAHAAALVAERPRTRAELAPLLAGRSGHLDAEALSWAFSYLVPVVQVTPRGLWGASGRAALTTLEHWLGRPVPELERGTALEEVVLRYLRAFGPAAVRDVQAWCGLTRLREVAERLRPRLRRFRGEDGAQLWDVPDGVLPGEDVPAPVRFLPEYDNATLGYAHRARVVADAEHIPLQGGPGGAVGTVLVDGLVSATWALHRTAGPGGTALLHVRPSLPLGAAAGDVETEGERLRAFLAPGAAGEVRLATA
ncbi:winged helix DNA-binding domain-containing protein [Kineococcus glutinatus]|uniref:winged helix DNA-binding domain-containing protein n=1 Tax=Kineococcus glutinatus TaxID=1070872 RepID=UPI0031E9C37E